MKEDNIIFTLLEKLEESPDKDKIVKIFELIKKEKDIFALACLAEIAADQYQKQFWPSIWAEKIMNLAESIETRDAEEKILRDALIKLAAMLPVQVIINKVPELQEGSRILVVIIRALRKRRLYSSDERIKVIKVIGQRFFTGNRKIRQEIARTLQKIGTAREVPYLISMISRAIDYYTRKEWIQVINSIISKDEQEFLEKFKEGLQLLES